MTTRFDRDTAVLAVADGVFECRIDRGWWIVQGPNGGYVAALILRALEAAVADDERAVRSLTVHFTAVPHEGPARVETRVERAGRSLSTVTGRLLQDDRLLAVAVAAFSKSRKGPEFAHRSAPAVPPPERAAPLPGVRPGETIPMHGRYDYRWCVGSPPGSNAPEALIGGWIRSAEPRIADALLVTAFTDAWPPACFAVAREPAEMGLLPTVELTVHFRCALPRLDARPGDFLLTAFRSRLAQEGFIEETGEIWDRQGQLLAQSRQLAILG